MWVGELFGGKKPVIGMIHLDALPGTVLYNEALGLGPVIEHAKEDYHNLVEGGIDGVIFCNENDKPYSKNVGKEVVAAMTAIIHSVIGQSSEVPYGIDVQWDCKASLAVALAVKAAFIRGITCGTFCGDLGLFTPDTLDIMKYRHLIGGDHIKVLTNLVPEFSASLDFRPLSLIAQTVVKSSLVDGICVSGAMAGGDAPYEQLKEIKDVMDGFPVFANTGVNFSSIKDIIAVADACVVATCLKVDAKPYNRIDRDNVTKLMSLIRESR